MSGNPALRVVLCWHMHQPPYQDPIGGRFQSPWTYLHGLKDYVDMAAHLEAVPEAKAVVNFTPVLLEQIEDYAKQMASAARGQDNVHDPLLAALAHPVSVGSDESRLSLVKACLRADRKRLIDRFPPFARLASIADWAIGHPEGLIYLNDQFLIDLVVWYHLAWLGETVRREDATAQRLMAQGRNFTLNDRQELLGLMADLMGGIIPRYRTLAQRGQIELSVTPFSHPIIPLLLGFDRARETMSNVALPLSPSYPGGEARARWQIEHSKEVFGRHFGYIPAGVWPAEGGVCPRTLELLGEAGFKWTATGQGVLHNSLGHSHLEPMSCIGRIGWAVLRRVFFATMACPTRLVSFIGTGMPMMPWRIWSMNWKRWRARPMSSQVGWFPSFSMAKMRGSITTKTPITFSVGCIGRWLLIRLLN